MDIYANLFVSTKINKRENFDKNLDILNILIV